MDETVALMRNLCDEMGIEWDDAAEALEINGKPIDDDFKFNFKIPRVVYSKKKFIEIERGEEDGCC